MHVVLWTAVGIIATCHRHELLCAEGGTVDRETEWRPVLKAKKGRSPLLQPTQQIVPDDIS
jgi:hypothetical protein